MSFFSKFIKEFGIDLGTSNSLIYIKGGGIVVNEPSIVAINNKTSQILAVGEAAKKMSGREPTHVSVIRPLIGGVVSDFDITQEILRQLLNRFKSLPISYYHRAVVSVPGGLTEVERKSVEDAILGAGISRVHLIDATLAGVIGARLPVAEPAANLIVDIGGGTTEIAVISLSGVVAAKSLKVAGDRFNNDIIEYVRDEFRLIVGEPTAEALKIAIGSAVPIEGRLELAIRGRDLGTGLPREVLVKNNQVRLAISRSLNAIVENIKTVIEATPPELVGDILEKGIYVCGGGALLRGMDQLIKKELSINATVVEDPLTCVARGLGIIIEDFDKYAHLFTVEPRIKSIKL